MSLLVSLAAPVEAQETAGATFVRALDRMMVELGPQSARDARTIRDAYRGHLDLLVIDRLAELERALYTGGLARLPDDPLRFNLAPRLAGAFPIGEKDLLNQVSYIAARPATIGALLDIASRVKSGPMEVTSMVRHTEYQGALKATNRNATTSVPMHTMGLAFDIALVNTPLETVYEIRDVLRRMRAAGEILFIGERRQLVFHVVPHPSRLGHFTDVYTAALGAPPAAGGLHVVAFPGRAGTKDARKKKPTARVTAEIVAVLPASEFAEEWWRAVDHGDVSIEVSAPARREPEPVAVAAAAPSAAGGPAAPLLTMLLAALSAGWRVLRPQPVSLRLFDRPSA